MARRRINRRKRRFDRGPRSSGPHYTRSLSPTLPAANQGSIDESEINDICGFEESERVKWVRFPPFLPRARARVIFGFPEEFEGLDRRAAGLHASDVREASRTAAMIR